MIMNDDIEWTNDNESCCRDLTMFRYTCSGTTCNAVNILSFSDGLWGRPRKPRKAHERTYRPSKNVILTRQYKIDRFCIAPVLRSCVLSYTLSYE